MEDRNDYQGYYGKPQGDLNSSQVNTSGVFFAFIIIVLAGGFLVHIASAILMWVLPLIVLIDFSVLYLRNQWRKKKVSLPVSGWGTFFAVLTIICCGYFLVSSAVALIHWLLPILILVAIASLYLEVQWRRRFPKVTNKKEVR